MPRATLPALLLALLLLVSLATVEAQRGRGQGEGDDDGTSDSGDDAGGDGDDPGDEARGRRGPGEDARGDRDDARHAFLDQHRAQREACRELNGTARAMCQQNLTAALRAFHEEQRDLFRQDVEDLRGGPRREALGGFVLQQGEFAGRFVSFTWDAASASVLDYTVAGCLVFDRVQLTGLAEDAELRFQEHGRVLEVRADDARLLVHDNPRGALVGRSPENGTLAFTLAADVQAALAGARVDLTGCADWRGLLVGHALRLDGQVATVDGRATFLAHEAHPAEPGPGHEDDDEVDEAAARGRVGAEIHVVGDDAEDVATTLLDEGIEAEVLRGDGRVRVVVNGSVAGGRTFIVNVAPGLLQGDRVAVRYYDEASGTFTEVPITAAGSFEDVLDPDDDAGPEYFVRHTSDGTVAYVSVDRFSTHAFEVFGVLDTVPPSALAGLVGGAVLVALAAAGLARRRSP